MDPTFERDLDRVHLPELVCDGQSLKEILALISKRYTVLEQLSGHERRLSFRVEGLNAVVPELTLPASSLRVQLTHLAIYADRNISYRGKEVFFRPFEEAGPLQVQRYQTSPDFISMLCADFGLKEEEMRALGPGGHMLTAFFKEMRLFGEGPATAEYHPGTAILEVKGNAIEQEKVRALLEAIGPQSAGNDFIKTHVWVCYFEKDPQLPAGLLQTGGLTPWLAQAQKMRGALLCELPMVTAISGQSCEVLMTQPIIPGFPAYVGFDGHFKASKLGSGLWLTAQFRHTMLQGGKVRWDGGQLLHQVNEMPEAWAEKSLREKFGMARSLPFSEKLFIPDGRAYIKKIQGADGEVEYVALMVERISSFERRLNPAAGVRELEVE